MTLTEKFLIAGSAARSGDWDLAEMAAESALQELRPLADGFRKERLLRLAALGWKLTLEKA